MWTTPDNSTEGRYGAMGSVVVKEYLIKSRVHGTQVKPPFFLIPFREEDRK